MNPPPAAERTWHSRYGGREWSAEAGEMLSRDRFGVRHRHRTLGAPVSMRRYLRDWGGELRAAREATGVPVPLLLATLGTENGPWRPAEGGGPRVLPQRREPGYTSWQETPHRISVGPCHVLLSTARGVMGEPGLPLAWLHSVPNNILAAARYIAAGQRRTGWEPILVAARYNAGGLYDASSSGSRFHNRWHLRSWGDHLDRYADWYGDALVVVPRHHWPPPRLRPVRPVPRPLGPPPGPVAPRPQDP